jgi:HEAT repeat protein
VLAELKVKQSDAALARQMLEGSTLYSRMQAIRNLSKEGAGVAEESLLKLVMDADQPVVLRLEAYRLVTKGWSLARVVVPIGADRWEVREARANRLGELCTPVAGKQLSDPEKGALARALLTITAEDPSQRVRCAAIRAMGRSHDPDLDAVIFQAMRTESHTDALRQAAIDAAVNLNTKEAMHQVAMICDTAFFARTRAAAVDAVAKLSTLDPALAFEVMDRHLNDRVVRVQRTSAEGMVRLKNPKGIDAFDRAISLDRSWAMKRQLEKWQGDLEKALAKPSVPNVTEASTPKK